MVHYLCLTMIPNEENDPMPTFAPTSRRRSARPSDVSLYSRPTLEILEDRNVLTAPITTTSLVLSSSSTYSTSPVTLTATVTQPSGFGPPLGDVTFFVDNNFLAFTQFPFSETDGPSVSISTTFLPSEFGTSVGVHTVQAQYNDGVGIRDSFTSISKSQSLFVEKTPTNPLGFYAIGSGPNVNSAISVYSSAGALVSTFSPFGTFQGGVRVAVGAVYGNSNDPINAFVHTGTPMIIAAAGPGGLPLIRIFTTSGELVQSFLAYDSLFTGGVYVASAPLTQNINGDVRWEIITGPGAYPNCNGLVKTFVFSYPDVTPFGNGDAFFQPYPGSQSDNGVMVSAGDLYGSGTPDLLTSQVLPSSGYLAPVSTKINVYTVTDVVTLYQLKTTFDPLNGYAGGYSTAIVPTTAGERLVVGSGPGDPPTVVVIDPLGQVKTTQFTPYEATVGGGVFVASIPVPDANGAFTSGDFLTSSSTSSPSLIHVFDGVTLGTLKSFTAFPNDINGAFIAGA